MDGYSYAEEFLALKYNSRKMIMDSEIQRAVTGEEFVLNFLNTHEEPVSPTELKEKMLTSTARVAAILKKLESTHYIERTEDDHDARKHGVHLSETGLDAARAIHNKKVQMLAEIFEGIGEEDTKTYIRITEHILSLYLNGRTVQSNERTDSQKERPVEVFQNTEHAGPA